MSSLRNAVKRKTHKERGQLSSRRRLGLLEKKKDYKLRANDFHAKEKRLRALRNRAAFRNPDEFYFKMVNSKTKDGVHVIDREQVDEDVVKLVRTQNHTYVQLHNDIEASKIKKLQNNLHFIDAAAGQNRHTIFVDDEDEAESFDKVDYFETTDDFADRAFNRPTKKQLGRDNLLVAGKATDVKKALKSSEHAYEELEARLDRQDKLKNAMEHMELYKKLSGKGKKYKVKDAEKGRPAVYKWKQERKR
mmetsp:Transcript_5817/g.10164  ORF Transcript_5817/g.10164 Transcript_5817/m.10164 type:complete len:248 (-) Transcript_5817:2108-2851(-)